MGAQDMCETYAYYDVAVHALNKVGEELCGDRTEVFKSDEGTFLVMADGLGSGVKANILASLTVKIAMTMLRSGESLVETIDTIMQTLPVCSVRKVAYSTFCMIHISNKGNCRLIEYHNPDVFLIRNHLQVRYPYHIEIYGDKEVRISEFQLEEGDFLTLVSDGAIHAGVGQMLNHGWEWEHIASHLEKQTPVSAESISSHLIEACNKLYDGRPGDDTTVATIMVKRPQLTKIFSGPPESAASDGDLVQKFMRDTAQKIVCGGTAANIVARELKRTLYSDLDYYEPSIPPIAHIKGIDLVTEGVLTLRHVNERLDAYLEGTLISFDKKDGATLLCDALINKSTHVHFCIGKAINPAHQNPDFPFELSIKLHVLEKLIKNLKSIGKIVTVEYV